MARSVQIRELFSDLAQARFLIFTTYFIFLGSCQI